MCQQVNIERPEVVEQVNGPNNCKNLNDGLNRTFSSNNNLINNEIDEKKILDFHYINNFQNEKICVNDNEINDVEENNLNDKVIIDNNNNNNNKCDFYTQSIQYTREFFEYIKETLENFKKSIPYKVLAKTTQPAHVVIVLTVLTVLYILWPNITDPNLQVKKEKNGLSILFYLGSFATHFGAQIWMTFVSGLALYFSLPRHIFGLCQQVLFPKYYCLGSILSIFTLILFVKSNTESWGANSVLQTIALALCALTELGIRLYLAPPLLRLMKEKHQYEFKAGTGSEIGHLDQGGLKRCTSYQKIQKSFRRFHSLIAIGNIISLTCTCIHLQYLAQRITL